MSAFVRHRNLCWHVALLATMSFGCGQIVGADAGIPPDSSSDAEVSPEPMFTITPASRDFGDVGEGCSSADVTFTVTNTGTGPSAALTTTVGGRDLRSFVVGADTCDGARLAPSATCTIAVSFSPASVRTASAALNVGDGSVSAMAVLEGNGTSGDGLRIAPTVRDFGMTTIGTATAPRRFTVENDGCTAPSGTIAIVIGGTDASQFILGADDCSGMALTSDTSCTFEGIYLPTATGSHSAWVGATASPGGMANAAVTGNASLAIDYAIMPSLHDFGPVLSGSSSATVDFTLRNVGASPSGIITHTFGGADAAEFRVTASTCEGAPIAAGATCTITVRFDAGALGPKTATLDVREGGGMTVSATLTGTSGCGLSISPATGAFGLVPVGTGPVTASFTVRNSCAAATGTIASVLAGPDASEFSVTSSSCLGAPLAGGATCTITVRFSPGTVGGNTASLEVTDGSLVASAALTPTVVPCFYISPPTHGFGPVPVGTASVAATFTVHNSCAATSGIPAVSLTGPLSTQFSIRMNSCTSSLVSGGTCTVSVELSPTTTGAKTGLLEVTAGPGGTTSASLSGTGT